MLKRLGRVGQGLVAVLLIGLGLVVGWQALPKAGASAIEDETQAARYSVRGEVSDFAMFGKNLTAERPNAQTVALKPGSGPVVPAHLRIPAIEIEANFETLAVKDGRLDVPTNVWNVGWLGSSGRPGELGNAIVDGHKDTVHGPAVFWDLKQLKKGDRVYVSDEGGYELTFEVREVASYGLTDAPLSQIFGPTAPGVRQLTLITCDGHFDKEAATYERRLVVYAQEVETN